MRAHRGFFARHSEPDISAHREFYARGGDVDDDFQQYHVVQNAAGGGVIKTIADLFKPGIRDLFHGNAGVAVRDAIKESKNTGNEAGRIGNYNFVEDPLKGDRLSVNMHKTADGQRSELSTFVDPQYGRSNAPWFSLHTHPPRFGYTDEGRGVPFSYLDDETRQRAREGIPGLSHPSGINGDMGFWFNNNPNRHVMMINPLQEDATVAIGDPMARLGTDPRLREKVTKAASAGATPDPTNIWQEVNRIYGFHEDEPNLRAYDQVRRMRQASDLPIAIDEAAAFGDKGGTLKDAMQDYYRMLKPDFAEGGSVDDDMQMYHPIAYADGGKVALSLAKFMREYMAHIDLRGREAGNAAENAKSIMENGWQRGSGATMLPPYPGGEPRDMIEQRYRPLAGDKAYLVPRSGRTETRDRAHINEGWKPEPHEMLDVPEDNASLYDLYLNALKSKDDGFARGGHFANCYGGEVYG